MPTERLREPHMIEDPLNAKYTEDTLVVQSPKVCTTAVGLAHIGSGTCARESRYSTTAVQQQYRFPKNVLKHGRKNATVHKAVRSAP